VGWGQLDICRLGADHGILLIGYRFFDRAAKGTAIADVMRKRYFVPFSITATGQVPFVYFQF